GNLLTMEIARAASELGITRIDLGKGEEAYKQSLASGNTLVAEGAMDFHPVRGLMKKQCHQTYHWLRTTPFRSTFRRSFRTMKRWAFATQSFLSSREDWEHPASPLEGVLETQDEFPIKRT
ncbi:MAG: GNAT family N-acetyltransferase, partial [Planctomycetaceae bacterium]|nr:GNAT family N-acetyltransferase [Planctomycetaceae bacterium]